MNQDHYENEKPHKWILTINGLKASLINVRHADIPARVPLDIDSKSPWRTYGVTFVDTFETDVITELEHARNIGRAAVLDWRAKLCLFDPVGAVTNTWEFTLLHLVELTYNVLSHGNEFPSPLNITARFDIGNVKYTSDGRKKQ